VTGKTLYSILHRIMDLTLYQQFTKHIIFAEVLTYDMVLIIGINTWQNVFAPQSESRNDV